MVVGILALAALFLVAIVYYARRNRISEQQFRSIRDDSDSSSLLSVAVLGGSSDGSSHPHTHGHDSHHGDAGGHHGVDAGHVGGGHFDGGGHH